MFNVDFFFNFEMAVEGNGFTLSQTVSAIVFSGFLIQVDFEEKRKLRLQPLNHQLMNFEFYDPYLLLNHCRTLSACASLSLT